MPYGTPISADAAKKIATAAIAEARKNNWAMAVAIVDPGHLLGISKGCRIRSWVVWRFLRRRRNPLRYSAARQKRFRTSWRRVGMVFEFFASPVRSRWRAASRWLWMANSLELSARRAGVAIRMGVPRRPALLR